jgi:molybdopterin synthase catalytic subunit
VVPMPTGLLLKKNDPIDLARLMSNIRESVKGMNCGSVVTFTGIVRGRTHEGKKVNRLEYEVFEEAARRSIENMARAITLLDGVLEATICHRYGTFSPGEEVLYVVIATERSDLAIDALRLAVTIAKHEIPIWKKEHTTDGSYWVDIE